ncbi:transposase family protein [Nonomuraea sp. NPDC003709]|uniref:transposase family protein n=1 Tax=Nonomuraea sp. NPDC003709 TaxID=3154450 RepID=UPI0033A9781B
MPSSTIDVLSRHLEHVALTDPASDLPTLAQVLDAVPDPRHRRGRRYRLGPLLALSLLAVLSGATSLAKITRFIAGYNPRPAHPTSGSQPPSSWPPAPLDGCSPAWTVMPSTP